VEVLIAIAILALVAAFVSVPLRRSASSDGARQAAADAALAALEARKQAKYREIRDTELDRAQGKLSEADFRRQNAELRAEAIAILKQIDAQRPAVAPREAATDSEGEREPGRGSV
jgi:type II secretory pathway pseudopilin PulG